MAWGVVLLDFTDDGQVVLGRRRSDSRARPGGLDVSVVEGVNAVYDAIGPTRLSVEQACLRGAREELGLELAATDITLLGSMVDMDFYQWNVVGTVDTGLTAAEVLAAHGLHARDRWEGRLEMVPANPETVFERLYEGGGWDTALIALLGNDNEDLPLIRTLAAVAQLVTRPQFPCAGTVEENSTL